MIDRINSIAYHGRGVGGSSRDIEDIFGSRPECSTQQDIYMHLYPVQITITLQLTHQ